MNLSGPPELQQVTLPCGCLAGPLLVTAVYLFASFLMKGIHDSKKLKEHEKELLVRHMHADKNIVFHTEVMSNVELDAVGGLGPAWHECVKRAVFGLQTKLKSVHVVATSVIIDGNKSVDLPLEVKCIEKADSIYVGVACASILSKVCRDAYMTSIASSYPDFEVIFRDGKGYYHSKKHADLIESGRFTDLHRRTYNPLKSLLAESLHTTRVLVPEGPHETKD